MIFLFFCDYPILRNEKKLPLFLLNMGQQHCQDHIIRPEGYPCHQILYCTKGSGTLILDGNRIPISPYTVIYMPAYYPHEYYAEENVWDIHWVVPAGFAVNEILVNFGLEKPQVFEFKNINTLENLFCKMHEAIRSDSVFGNYKASGYLYDFLIEFYRIISFSSSYASPNHALTKAVDHINLNYTSHISMEDLCAVSGVSKQYLCLLFRKILSCRPTEYIAKRRIQAAKEILTGTAKTVEDIALETGFCSESYFCKLFKRYEGITPTAFRNTE